MKTINKLKQLIVGVYSDDLLDLLKTLPSPEICNEAIMCHIILALSADNTGVFLLCDFMEKLCDDVSAKKIINSFKNGKNAHSVVQIKYLPYC